MSSRTQLFFCFPSPPSSACQPLTLRVKPHGGKMAANVPGIKVFFKGGRMGKEQSQQVFFPKSLLFWLEEVLQIYCCFALVRPGSQAHPSMSRPLVGEGRAYLPLDQGVPGASQTQNWDSVSTEKEDNDGGMGDSREKPWHTVLMKAVIVARNTTALRSKTVK